MRREEKCQCPGLALKLTGGSILIYLPHPNLREEKMAFEREALTPKELEWLEKLGRLCRGDILKMTTLASSGHPGGAMSSVDIYLTLYSFARVEAKNPHFPERDRIVISHGHTSAATYSALGRLGFFSIDLVISKFRKAGTPFEGHIVRRVPGIEWGTGNLGQGLSAGCGFALAAKLFKKNWHTFVCMSDGEQTKGQVAEARRFAKKFGLTDLTVIIDYNELQISGSIHEVMPQNIKEGYKADGWKVLEIDGHNFQEIYQALREAVREKDFPVVILAHTTMGKGVSFMEDNPEFHGKPLKIEEYREAMRELGLKDDLEKYRVLREKEVDFSSFLFPPPLPVSIEVDSPRTYREEDKLDNRTAFGKVMEDIASLNYNREGKGPVAVFDCDLAGSVKTVYFASLAPEWFFQGGVQEHNTATIAGALSSQGIITFFADFGVFGVDETFNQQRLNDMNGTNLKLICTHCGLDVGEDGKTHQCIDYIGVLNNLYGYRIIIPADPNQTDRVIRYIARERGNFFVGMGRSKLPVILDTQGKPFFGRDYEFEYGKAEVIREGEDATIITLGSMLYRALQAWELLKVKGYLVRVLNFPCPTSPDREAIKKAAETGVIVTYEDHNVKTGLGSIIAGVIAEEGLCVRFRRMGVKKYGDSGKPDELFQKEGLDFQTLARVVEEEIKRK